jgi:hypothetical protein
MQFVDSVMQLDGFTFDEIYLRTPNAEFDLHNCFDFTGFNYEISTRSLVLQWRANQHARGDAPYRITVRFRAVSHLSVEPRDHELPFTEDDSLWFVAYASPGETVGESFAIGNPTSNMHLVFCFMSKMRL